MASLLENGNKGAIDESPAIRKQFLGIFEKLYLAYGSSARVAACYLLHSVADDNARSASKALATIETGWHF